MRKRLGLIGLAVVLAAPFAGAKEPPSGAPEAPAAPEANSKRAWLGVRASPIDPEDRADYGLKHEQAGILLLDVVEGGPAQKAGVAAGDVLLAVDGKPVASPEDLGGLVQKAAPGQKLKLDLARDGEPVALTVQLGEAPAPADEEKAMAEKRRQQEAMLAMLPPALREKMKAIQQLAEKKSKALAEKYRADGLSEEEIQRRVQEDLHTDPEFKEALEEFQKAAQEGMGGAPGQGH